MPTTLTPKNIPDGVYERLKASASAHRRSLNGEAIVCLEWALEPCRPTVEERLRRAREPREGLPIGRFPAEEIDELKRHGRP